MLRTAWVLVAGILLTLRYGSGVLLATLLRSPRRAAICRAAPRLWGGGLLRAAGVRVEVEGVEHLRRDGPQVIAANHESWFDVFALAATLPVDYRFVAKQELSRIPLFGAAWLACGHISINREDRHAARESLGEAGRKIREEALTVILFPEGTRSPDGRLLPFKKGAFVLAIQMGVPLVPVGISGSRAVMAKGAWRVRPGIIRIRIGAPIAVEGLALSDRDALLEQGRTAILSLRSEEGGGAHPPAPSR